MHSHKANPYLPLELQFQIIQNLRDDLHSLINALYVCKAWSDEAASILWRDIPIEALKPLSPASQQYYANKITKLNINCDDDTNVFLKHQTWQELLPTSSFTRLSNLYITIQHPINLHNKQIFHFPSLKSITLNVNVRWPSPSWTQNWTTEQLISLFNHLTPLRELNLDILHNRILNADELLIYLSQLEDLQSLKLCANFTHSTLEHLLIQGEPCFRNLSTLEISLTSKEAVILPRVATNLKTLTVHLLDSSSKIFHSFAELEKLEGLSVHFKASVTLSQQDLLDLSSLRNLRTLEISPEVGMKATEGDLGEFLKDMAGLRVLDLKELLISGR
ncbi:hypothetical protein K470DRAFT_255898 [Piedraia hortae CBS 480.64]|uniref:F-box domain-containing protein n=1 Tax=Piedraia hortae CBS 480.64 TaxID=1314780 RepID=A0A6A7C5T6_9PEZI|nr:hypothetical protein K470DRAFT_255898 [Piedraia hortae CBS 480.64]